MTTVEPAATPASSPVPLDPAAAFALLDTWKVPMPRQALADTPGAAAQAATGIGFPVVLKAVASGLAHKSDVGGVRVSLLTADAVADAARAMAAGIPALNGYLVQEMAAPGLELIAGLKRDPAFGPVLMVGLGGVWVEVLRDVALRLAPVTYADATAMLAELRGAPLLSGYRGAPAVDREALVHLLVRLGRLAVADPDILELDLNPIIARSDGVIAVDVRVVRAPFSTGVTARSARDADAVERVLNPRSIVVVGASTSRAKQGGRLFHYLLKHGFAGPLYAVNPRASVVMGRPSFPSISELPGVPDLACIMVPAEVVPGVVEDCGRKGIRSAVVYTSGFAEIGEQGREAQAALVEVARRHGVRLCGPNTAGVVNVGASTCAAFGMAFEVERMPSGGIAFLTQSGALGSSLLSRCWDQGIGFSHWASTGNEADLTLSDYLLYLANDPAARVIAVFMESIKDPQRFIEACERARATGTPIVVYKAGASEVGQRAVQSHTGSLAGDDAVYDAVFRANGVVRVHDLQALVDGAVALAWQPLPRGRRVGVISASGGACGVIADECARQGLQIPLLPAETVARIARIIPPFGVSQNPIDVTMEITVNPGMVGQVSEILLEESCIDALIVLMTTNADPPARVVAEGVVHAARAGGKPVIVARVGAEFLAPAAIAYYRESRIPLFPMPDRAVKALKAMVDVESAHRGVAASRQE